MKTCKNCLHYEACNPDIKITVEMFRNVTNVEPCKHFTYRFKCAQLPCYIGDTVYELFQNSYGETTINVAEVYAIELREPQRNSLIKTHYKTTGIGVDFQFSALGKTVFLTREGAEKAMERMKENEKRNDKH